MSLAHVKPVTKAFAPCWSCQRGRARAWHREMRRTVTPVVDGSEDGVMPAVIIMTRGVCHSRKR